MEVNKIYNMDCLEGMRTLPEKSVDLIITDPPYGIAYSSNYRKKKFDVVDNDDITNVAWLIYASRLLKPNGAIYCFTRWDVVGKWKSMFEFFGLKVKNCIVWDKELTGMGDLKGAYAPCHEIILYVSRNQHILRRGRPRDLIRIKRITGIRKHPTEKPPELIRELILNSSDEGDLILDPFVGSGTTAVASVNTKRKFIGFEINKDYCEIANKRLQQSILNIQ